MIPWTPPFDVMNERLKKSWLIKGALRKFLSGMHLRDFAWLIFRVVLGRAKVVNGYIMLKINFGMEENVTQVMVRYIVIDAPFSYNMII